MIRRIVLLALCVLALGAVDARALDPTRSISQFNHTSWSTEEGVPADIWAIAQTPDGYLWLGSIDGLYRFDGVRVERIASDLLPSPSIHALAATPSGGLWIGYERPIGVISLLENGVVRNFPIDAPSSTSVHRIVLGPNQSVWASTPDFVLRFDGERWRAIESDWGTSLGEASGGVWSFGVAGDGVVWSRNRSGLFYLAPGQSRFQRAEDYVGGVASFAATPDGRLWTTDSAAGHLYALPSWREGQGRVMPGPTPGIAVSEPLRGAILLDRDGSLWFTSSDGGGLRRARPQTRSAARANRLERFNAADGLSSNVVHSLFEDREGNIWVGTNLGLDRFRPANVVLEGHIPAGFRARFVQTSDGIIYAYSGWSNTSARASDGSESLYRILPGRAPELFIRNVGRLRTMLAFPESGENWFVTGRGLQRLSGARLLAPIALPQGVAGSSIYSAARDGDGAFWISAFRHGVYRQVGNGWRRVPFQTTGATAVLTADAEGGVWVRYSGGALFRVDGERTIDYSSRMPAIGDLTFIKADAEGLFIGGETGLARFEGGRFYALSAQRLPALSVVTGLDVTPDGNTWVFTQGGVLRFASRELRASLQNPSSAAPRFDLIGPRDGLPGAPYGGVYGSTLAVGSDGRVWFTTGQGLVWIDRRNLHRNDLAPPVVIRALTADGRVYTNPSNITLASGVRRVQIDYTALSLTIPERNRFRYKLDGVDDDWIDADERRQAFYTNLAPGSYRFRVIASNNDGVWNTSGASLAFAIPPTFVQSIWFTLLCLAVLSGVLWLLYTLRIRQVASRTRERLEERIAERERIARELHDTLLQGFHGLMLRFQSVADRIPASEPARQLMDSALERADQVLIEGRDRVRNLRAVNSGSGLLEELTRAAEQSSWNSAANFRAVTEGRVRELHPIVLAELAAIGQEALANAFGHAGASNIEVLVAYGWRALRLRVRDDGVGMMPEAIQTAERAGRFGLIGMQERARKIRARFTLSNRREGGVEVMVTVPAHIAYRGKRRASQFLETVEGGDDSV